jgi:hypothetical protein
VRARVFRCACAGCCAPCACMRQPCAAQRHPPHHTPRTHLCLQPHVLRLGIQQLNPGGQAAPKPRSRPVLQHPQHNLGLVDCRRADEHRAPSSPAALHHAHNVRKLVLWHGCLCVVVCVCVVCLCCVLCCAGAWQRGVAVATLSAAGPWHWQRVDISTQSRMLRTCRTHNTTKHAPFLYSTGAGAGPCAAGACW